MNKLKLLELIHWVSQICPHYEKPEHTPVIMVTQNIQTRGQFSQGEYFDIIHIKDPDDLGVLVHELVHFFQANNGIKMENKEDLAELEARSIEKRWRRLNEI